MDTIENDLTAPTKNPDTGKRIALDGAAAPARPVPAARTHVPGSALAADVNSAAAKAGTVTQHRYWVGVTASCPVNHIDLAGINFPKVNEQVFPSPNRDGTTSRRLVAGALVWLTEDKIRRMLDALPRTVIRFVDEQEQREEPGTGQNIGDVAIRPARGRVLTIPTAKDIEERRTQRKPTREYRPDPKRDVPAARFMFCVLCEDQSNPSRGDTYPEVLEVTGLDWPDTLPDNGDALRKLLS